MSLRYFSFVTSDGKSAESKTNGLQFKLYVIKSIQIISANL